MAPYQKGDGKFNLDSQFGIEVPGLVYLSV